MRGPTGVGIFLGTVALGAHAGDILQPAADYREFRHFQLTNGMSALAVHHPRATEAGFSVAAKTGSLYDPDGIPGLAHFLEHMLFLGTQKYPQPESYDSFMSQNGGGNNAYTDEERTVFFNKIADSALEEALDRFAEFFKNPLFNRDYEIKEVNAINAEHQKNIPNDDERSWFTIRSLAKGPMSRFSTGNLSTLQDIPKSNGTDVVDLLHDFHQKYYCGSNMAAVTISPKSLDEQEILIREKFEGISRGNTSWLGLTQCPGPEFNKVTPFDESNTGKYIHLQSFSGEPTLWVAFGLPPTLTSYKRQPMSVLSHVLEYSGEGSLVQRLRLLGLVDGLSLTMDRNSISTLLGLKVDLTTKGEKHRGLVLQEVFSYINFLKDNGISHDIVRSLSQQSQVDFHTTQPRSSVMNEAARLAHNLLTYEPYHVLAGDSLLIDDDPRLVNELLQKLEPDSAIIAFSDPSFVSKADDFQTDPYYGVQFRVIDLPQSHSVAMTVLTAAPNAFKMPPHLLHLPLASDLQIIPNLTGMEKPILLADGENAGASIWWQGHGAFALPRVTVQIQGNVSKDEVDLLSRAQYSVALSTIADQLSEEAVDFQNCGITFNVEYTSTGFKLFFEGYSKRQVEDIMALVAQKLADPQSLEAERFERVKAQQLKLLKDPATSMAFEHAVDAANVLTKNDAFNRTDLINALQETTFDDTVLSMSKLRKANMDAFVMGNAESDDALNMVQQFIKNAGLQAISREDAAQSLAMEQKQTIEATLANPIKGDTNHATLIQLQLGIPTIDERVSLAVLSQFINRRLYDSLRTEAQLGYIVGAREVQLGSTSELQCFVEGSKTHPDEVVKLIDAELSKAKDYLSKMSEAELQHWKNAMNAKLSKKDINSAEQFARIQDEIFSHANCFTKRDLEYRYLQRSFAKNNLLRTFTKLLEPSRKLTVKLIANLEPEKEVTLIGSPATEAQQTANNTGVETPKESRLLSLEKKFVSKMQQENGYFPDVAICDAPSDFIMRFEMMEDL